MTEMLKVRPFLLAFLLALLIFSAMNCNGTHSEVKNPPLDPLSLGGDLDRGWEQQGCEEGFIDGTYIGSESGLVCRWQRREGLQLRLRYEGFSRDGRRGWTREIVSDKRGFIAEGQIYGEAPRFYRIMQFFQPWKENSRGRRILDHSELEIIVRGQILCVYRSRDKAVVVDEELWSVPEDATLVKGRPCLEVEQRIMAYRR